MSLISPYGGKLVDLVASDAEVPALLEEVRDLKSIQLTARNMCDLEMLATGAFSPLTTFMGKSDYDRVLTEMRLASGVLWPLPITLAADPLALPPCGDRLVLRDTNFDIVAIMTIEEIFHWDRRKEAIHAYGTADAKHPMVAEMAHWGSVCISGPLKVS